jgi:DNA polymerase-3 subunit alpha (Gram-positive type)
MQLGFNIPLKLLGFGRDKNPDIDLNFPRLPKPGPSVCEELFGRENVYRAGTISTIAEKTAFGFVKKYAEDNSLTLDIRK